MGSEGVVIDYLKGLMFYLTILIQRRVFNFKDLFPREDDASILHGISLIIHAHHKRFKRIHDRGVIFFWGPCIYYCKLILG